MQGKSTILKHFTLLWMLVGAICFTGVMASTALGCEEEHQAPTTHQQTLFEGMSDDQLGFSSASEKEAIAEWLEKNDLNLYGDAKDTMYAGGTPLFNESTGESKTLYQHLLQKYPSRPWKQ